MNRDVERRIVTRISVSMSETNLTSCARGRTICPRPCTPHAAAQLQPIHTPYACVAQRALLPVAVGAMNIHDVRDRQTLDRRQTSDSIIA